MQRLNGLLGVLTTLAMQVALALGLVAGGLRAVGAGEWEPAVLALSSAFGIVAGGMLARAAVGRSSTRAIPEVVGSLLGAAIGATVLYQLPAVGYVGAAFPILASACGFHAAGAVRFTPSPKQEN